MDITTPNCPAREIGRGIFQCSKQKLRTVMAVTDGYCHFWQAWGCWKGDTIMKKIALIFALAFVFTAKMAVVTVVSHTDQAMADSAGTAIAYPEQVNACSEGVNC
jgi:hypothetical protein